MSLDEIAAVFQKIEGIQSLRAFDINQKMTAKEKEIKAFVADLKRRYEILLRKNQKNDGFGRTKFGRVFAMAAFPVLRYRFTKGVRDWREDLSQIDAEESRIEQSIVQDTPVGDAILCMQKISLKMMNANIERAGFGVEVIPADKVTPRLLSALKEAKAGRLLKLAKKAAKKPGSKPPKMG